MAAGTEVVAMSLPDLVNWIFQFADYIAFLLLASLGLIIILGIADIINLAHGELIMLGAYVTSATVAGGAPLILAVVLSTVAIGVFGLILERLFIRRFYDNKIGALVATWGLSLILSQGVLILFGPSLPPVPTPTMDVSYGGYSYSVYRLLLIAVAIAVLVLLWLVLYRTKFGIQVRATMQNADMARSLGTDTRRIYMITFAAGSALAGLTGALYAPTTSIVPALGSTFIAPAFITVVVGGGANPIVGSLLSSTFLSIVSTPVRVEWGNFLGLVALLLTALILIRFVPHGMSGWIRDFRRQRMARWRHT
jgi:branched-chain amino acid transport system permease protein